MTFSGSSVASGTASDFDSRFAKLGWRADVDQVNSVAMDYPIVELAGTDGLDFHDGRRLQNLLVAVLACTIPLQSASLSGEAASRLSLDAVSCDRAAHGTDASSRLWLEFNHLVQASRKVRSRKLNSLSLRSVRLLGVEVCRRRAASWNGNVE
jgi:hypothetical protein